MENIVKQKITEDIKTRESKSRIFEASEIKGLSIEEINEAEEAHDLILEKLRNGEELDEGFFKSLLGGAVGATVGPAIGRVICKVLGITENGTLGTLLTSRLVTTAMGIALGKS